MTEITARLSTALADRYQIERHLGEGDLKSLERLVVIAIACLSLIGHGHSQFSNLHSIAQTPGVFAPHPRSEHLPLGVVL